VEVIGPATGRRSVRGIVIGGLSALGLLVLARLGWVGDLVAIGAPLIAACSWTVAAMLAVVRRPVGSGGDAARTISAVLVGVGLCAATLVVGPRTPQRTGPVSTPLRVVAMNIQFDNPVPADAIADAVASDADVLVVSELTPATEAMLDGRYPHAVTEDLGADGFGQGVYSRFPLTELDRPDVRGQVLRLRVEAPTPFVLYALHLPRPVLTGARGSGFHDFAGHRRAVLQLDGIVDRETEPVVIAGDLNLSDRATGYRRLVDGRVDAARTGWAASSFGTSLPWRLLMLRIDHVLIPGDWCVARTDQVPITGSDHRGIVTDVGPCAPPS
jgi:endonuclease/exonuclease/phosphatase (EEP) superfamily protein YafD